MEYVSKEKLHKELLEFRKKYDEALKNKTETPRYNDYIGKCIFDITERYATKAKFSSYTYIDEMKSDAIEDCVKYLHNFDPYKYNNPFAYITQIVHNAFIRRIMKEQRNQYIKMVCKQKYQLEEQLVDNSYIIERDDVTSSYVKDFEEKQQAKKEKQKEQQQKKGIEKFIPDDDT